MKPLHEQLSGLQMRAVLALAVRTAERMFLRSMKNADIVTASRIAISIASDFVSGAQEDAIALRYATGQVTSLPSSSRSVAEAMLQLAQASHAAYDAVSSGSLSRDSYSKVVELTRDFLRVAETIAGTELRAPFRRDLRAVRNTHSGEVDRPGDVIDLGPNGPLGVLWTKAEEPDPPLDRRLISEAKIYAANAFVSPGTIAEFQPDFVCFYLGNEEMVRAVTDTLNAAHEARFALKPRPGFYVYAPSLDQAKRIELIALGAIVVADEKISGHTPKNVEEFAQLLKQRLDDSLYRWAAQSGAVSAFVQPIAGTRPQAGTTYVAKAQNPGEVESDYSSVLEWLTTAPGGAAEY